MSRRFSDAVQSISVRSKRKSVAFGSAALAAARRRHSHQPAGTASVVTTDESRALHSLKPPLVSPLLTLEYPSDSERSSNSPKYRVSFSINAIKVSSNSSPLTHLANCDGEALSYLAPTISSLQT